VQGHQGTKRALPFGSMVRQLKASSYNEHLFSNLS
jgi:hypothetical protein